jgi:hypothetical protein
MTALSAAKEPDLAFISRTELAEPPDCKVIFALGTPYLDSGHGLCLTFLLNNDNLILTALDSALHLITVINLPDITAFPAFQLAPRRNQHTFTFRTEHGYSMRKQRRLTLLSGKNTCPANFYAINCALPL